MNRLNPVPQTVDVAVRLQRAASDLCARTAGIINSGMQMVWFQINPDVDFATARKNRQKPDAEGNGGHGETSDITRLPLIPWLEILLIALLFGLFAGQLPPDVNESHYLTKAKHFWNPEWCPEDVFLSSAFSHWWFYLSTGWLTQLVSLSVYAWIGRIVTWLLLAFAWHRLSTLLMPRYGFAFVSAALFLVLNERFHLAGEWVVGGFESKGIAYAFVILAIDAMIRDNWNRVWVYCGAAAAFHVLVGGWSLLVLLLCCSLSRFLFPQTVRSGIATEEQGAGIHNRFRNAATALIFAAGLTALGAIPPLLTDLNSDPAISLEASRIYVQSRISHHLLFGAFPTIFVARFTVIMLVWGLLAVMLSGYRPIRRLQMFCAGSLLISLGGLILSGLAVQEDWTGDTSCRLLRFYWFRLSDFALPAAFSLSSTVVLGHWLHNRFAPVATRISAAVFCILILTATGFLILDRNSDSRPRADQRSLPAYEGQEKRTRETFENWLRVCRWVAANTADDAVFITPADQQTFKWYAGRTEVACWKDIPQDAASIIEWNNRLSNVFVPQQRFDGGLMSFSDEQLTALATNYGADYLLLPQKHVDLAQPPTQLRQVYPEAGRKSTYVVLEVSRDP